MSTVRQKYVKDALEVAHVAWYGRKMDMSVDGPVLRAVLALDAAGLLLTPEDKACVEACVASAERYSVWDNGTSATVDAGRAILAKRKKPERWTVRCCDDGDHRPWVVDDNNPTGARATVACFMHESDARAYAAKKNAEEAQR
jgi:hypothetical protein